MHQIQGISLPVYQSAAAIACENIRGRVHAGELRPGTRIRIDELCAGLGLSTTPVREALKVLEAEGLVQVIPRVGVYVRIIPVSEALDVYAIKEALEPIMVQMATERANTDERWMIHAMSTRLVELAEAEDVRGYVALIESRRDELLRIARSDVLTAMFQAVEGRTRLLRYRNLAQPGRMKISAAEHLAIADAMVDADSVRAAQLAARHVKSATESVRRLLEDESFIEPVDEGKRVAR
jgi:DNA-binding GntR family transcriptional regulator